MPSISYRDLQEITSSALPKQLTSEGAIVITIDNSQSKMDGLDKMTLREINSLIKRTRREQKRYSDS